MKRGIVLITTMIIIFALLAVILAQVSYINASNKIVSQYLENLQEYYLSEANNNYILWLKKQ